MAGFVNTIGRLLCLLLFSRLVYSHLYFIADISVPKMLLFPAICFVFNPNINDLGVLLMNSHLLEDIDQDSNANQQGCC